MKNKKTLSNVEKKSVWTFFTILFPSLILCIILAFPRSIELSTLAILLFIYQAIILKSFIETYYGKPM